MKSSLMRRACLAVIAITAGVAPPPSAASESIVATVDAVTSYIFEIVARELVLGGILAGRDQWGITVGGVHADGATRAVVLSDVEMLPSDLGSDGCRIAIDRAEATVSPEAGAVHMGCCRFRGHQVRLASRGPRTPWG